MTRPRSALVSLEATPYYHCIARCVRRSFLFGIDDKGRDLNHRKPWFLKRLKLLGEVFAIDIPAYAVMSNHYHLVLHVDQARSASWSPHEVISRWRKLYAGPAIIHRFENNETLSEAELIVVNKSVELWRSRLCSISWFMSCLNYYIALHANKEDGCTGRFWEGRFKSQALLDETALLSCMAYVDLNPIRAGMADTLEESDFTSIQLRIRRLQGRHDKDKPKLMPFNELEGEKEINTILPYSLKDYLQLVDWNGGVQHQYKKARIKIYQPRILASLGLSEKQWQLLAIEIQKESVTMLNGLDKLSVLEKRENKRDAA